MYYSLEDSESFSIDGGTSGHLFPSHPQQEQTIAKVSLDGVYPETGMSLNSRCTETLYMLEGELRLTAGDETLTLQQDDMYMILPGTPYRIEGKGVCLDIITPAWDKSQNKIIEIDGDE